jgi:vacuolar protein sorting-associated protein 54
LDLSDILASACELANARAAKILGVRADQHAALSITEFVEIFKENWDFVVATEALAKRMIVSLRGVTATQVSYMRPQRTPS